MVTQEMYEDYLLRCLYNMVEPMSFEEYKEFIKGDKNEKE